MVGVYDRKRSTQHYLDFKAGARLESAEPPVITFDQSMTDELRAYDCLGINALIPLVSQRLAETLVKIGREDVQLIDTRAIAKDGELIEYKLVNILSFVDCIDKERSLTTNIAGAPTAIMSFDRLVFKENCMAGRAFGRERHYHSLLLVADWAGEALLKARMKDLYLATSDEFFPPRGGAHRAGNSRH
jgi:hypothetical protein